MSALDDLVSAHSFPGFRAAARLSMLLIAGFFGWAYFAQLDEVAVATGEVVPRGKVKVIQHLEGGIVERIYVAEGAKVSEGDRLIRLGLGVVGANREELQVQIDGLILQRARLGAEASGSALKFPEDVAARLPRLVRTERDAYAGRKKQMESALLVFHKQSRQRELAVKELAVKLKGRRASLRLAAKRFEMSKDLLRNDLVPKMEHLKIENEVQNLRSGISELQAAAPKLREALAESRERERAERLNFERGVIEERGQVELAIARNRELLVKAVDQARRTLITSPIAGVVKNLKHHTIGGVVRAGEAIMEIVPTHERLVVEAKLDPVDVGYVSVGQPAVVKVLTYDYARYGGLDGEVINVAPDSSIDRDGRPYFRVVVRTAKTYMGETEGDLPITTGMETTVDIHTGTKSVLQYLIKPILKLKHEAFRER